MTISDGRQASVTWGALLAGGLGLLTFSSALLSVFIWIYVELSKQSKDLSDFRVQGAQSYVTAQALHAVEARSKEDKETLQHALDKMSERFDRSLEKMERVLIDRMLAPPGGRFAAGGAAVERENRGRREAKRGRPKRSTPASPASALLLRGATGTIATRLPILSEGHIYVFGPCRLSIRPAVARRCRSLAAAAI